MRYNNIVSKRLIFFIITTISVFLFNINNVYAQTNRNIYHPLSGSVLINADFMETFTFSDYTNSINNNGWRVYGEYFLPLYSNFFSGIRIYYGQGNLQGKQISLLKSGFPEQFKTSILIEGAGVELGYKISKYFYPYFFVGINYLYFDPKDNNGNRLPNNSKNLYSRETYNSNVEFGFRYFINDFLAVTAGYTQNFNTQDYLDDLNIGSHGDTYSQINLGISISLFADKDSDNDGVNDSNDLCPGTPQGIKVDEHGCPLDDDNDGVPNYLDKCPQTPNGVIVDTSGCPIDSDNDGIPDYLDKCPQTPKNIKVDQHGCPKDADNDGVPDYLDKCNNTPSGVSVDSVGCPIDSDHDGIADYLDKCPNTLKGVKVDSIGCPIDSDEDGIPDYLDKCPGTPTRVKVDSTGCPLDRDKDGVPDYLDKCPDSPLGVKVDSTGCTVKEKSVKLKTEKPKLSQKVEDSPIHSYQISYPLNAALFFRRSSALLPAAFVELNKIAIEIKADSGSTWRIEGYTDYDNPVSYDKVLSYNRANEVFNYFVSKGINKSRLQIIGTGKYLSANNKYLKNGLERNIGVLITRIEKR